MELKKIIFSLSVVFLFSCTEPQPEDKLYEYVLNNKSGVDMNMILYRSWNMVLYQTKNETISIVNDKEYRIEFKVDNYNHNYGDLSLLSCDSLGLIFNNNKKKIYKYSDKSNRNPLLSKSFVITEVNEYHYLFRYTFTEEDYMSIKN